MPMTSGLELSFTVAQEVKLVDTNRLVCKLGNNGHYIKFCDVASDFKTCPSTSTLLHLQ